MEKLSEMVNAFYKYAQDPLNNMRTELETFASNDENPNSTLEVLKYLYNCVKNLKGKYLEAAIIGLITGSSEASSELLEEIFNNNKDNPNIDFTNIARHKNTPSRVLINLYFNTKSANHSLTVKEVIKNPNTPSGLLDHARAKTR